MAKQLKHCGSRKHPRAAGAGVEPGVLKPRALEVWGPQAEGRSFHGRGAFRLRYVGIPALYAHTSNFGAIIMMGVVSLDKNSDENETTQR